LAVPLSEQNPNYEEREQVYKEVERAEEGLFVNKTDRKRHLALGYADIGDSMMRQLRMGDAHKAYKQSLEILSELNNQERTEAVSNDIVTINSKLSRLVETSRSTMVAELTGARILAITGGEGATRQVTVDRGTEDGVLAGMEGTIFSIQAKSGDHERKVKQIGTSRVIKTALRSAIVEVTMNEPSGDGLVQVGDMVQVSAKVPALIERSLLWKLAKFHVDFYSRDKKRIFFDYRSLYADENGETLARVLDAILEDIGQAAREFADRDFMKEKIDRGRFKDKTLREAMESATRQDVLDFLKYVARYPATYYGKDQNAVAAWAYWAQDLGAAQPGP
jgi:hypothetical protein